MEKGQGSTSSRAESTSDKEYQHWKSVIPVLYDCFTNHHLGCRSLSCRWGPLILRGESSSCQRLYLAEQSNGQYPNTLIITNCEVLRPRVDTVESMSEFEEQSLSSSVSKYKTLIHPGEVKRIRELPQNKNIVATHADSPDVLLWDLDNQPKRRYAIGVSASCPDLILSGHKKNAESLAMCHTELFVLSGGCDKSVILWNIEDCITSLASEKSESKRYSVLWPRGVFAGHGATVQDVQFCPSSAPEFCSVGDDSCLILWDTRSGIAPVIKVDKAHNGAVKCLDWNTHDVNLILTGSSDHAVRMLDRRKLTAGGVVSPIHKFEDHKSPVTSIQWCPDKSSVFATGAGDGILNIWDHDQVGNNKKSVRPHSTEAPGLLFKHAGHRNPIVDFHWNPDDPWTIASVSTETSNSSGGGTLQIWRMSDLLYRPEEEVIAELEKFKEHQEKCGSSTKSKKPKRKKMKV